MAHRIVRERFFEAAETLQSLKEPLFREVKQAKVRRFIFDLYQSLDRAHFALLAVPDRPPEMMAAEDRGPLNF